MGPDPLDVVGDPDDQGEDQRKRDVRGRGIDREGRDREPEDVDLVLGVGGKRQVADQVREGDEEEEGGDEREPADRRLPAQVGAGDVVLGQVVGDLDGLGVVCGAGRDRFIVGGLGGAARIPRFDG